jgi:hypothetical protein
VSRKKYRNLSDIIRKYGRMPVRDRALPDGEIHPRQTPEHVGVQQIRIGSEGMYGPATEIPGDGIPEAWSAI